MSWCHSVCVCTLHHIIREEALDVVDTLLGETGELVLHCVYFASYHKGRGLGCCRHLAGRDR